MAESFLWQRSAIRRITAGARSRIDRVLRGGSWNNNERNARCAYRNRNNPNNRNNNIGFRVVVLTFFFSKAMVRGDWQCGPGQ